jgi:hypothetical protein
MKSLTVEQTVHPCFGSRPLALAEQCEREGLENCAATIRGLLKERAALIQLLSTHKKDNEEGLRLSLTNAYDLMKVRGLIY